MRNKAKSAALLSCFVAIWSAGASAQNANDPRRKLDPVLNNGFQHLRARLAGDLAVPAHPAVGLVDLLGGGAFLGFLVVLRAGLAGQPLPYRVG